MKICIFLLSILCSYVPNSRKMGEGIYFGKDIKLDHNNIVYANYYQNEFSIEMFVVFKSTPFLVLKDTLTNVDGEYEGEKSKILIRKKRIYFLPLNKSSEVQFKRIRLKYSPTKYKTYELTKKKYKDKSFPFEFFRKKSHVIL